MIGKRIIISIVLSAVSAIASAAAEPALTISETAQLVSVSMSASTGVHEKAVIPLLEQATEQLSLGHLERASALLERALRIAPREALIWNTLAHIRRAQKRFQEAAAMAQKSIDFAPAQAALREDNTQIIAQHTPQSGGGVKLSQQPLITPITDAVANTATPLITGGLRIGPARETAYTTKQRPSAKQRLRELQQLGNVDMTHGFDRDYGFDNAQRQQGRVIVVYNDAVTHTHQAKRSGAQSRWAPPGYSGRLYPRHTPR